MHVELTIVDSEIENCHFGIRTNDPPIRLTAFILVGVLLLRFAGLALLMEAPQPQTQRRES